MIGYTGPIHCLRLYRTVILPRYSVYAQYPYLRCSILFLLHVSYGDRFPVINSKKLSEQIATAGQQKHESDVDGKL